MNERIADLIAVWKRIESGDGEEMTELFKSFFGYPSLLNYTIRQNMFKV